VLKSPYTPALTGQESALLYQKPALKGSPNRGIASMFEGSISVRIEPIPGKRLFRAMNWEHIPR